MDSEALPTVVAQYFEALNDENFELLETLWNPDVEFKAVGSRRRRGVPDVMSYFRGLFGPWAEHLDRPKRFVGGNDLTVVEVEFVGTSVGGKPLNFDAVDVFDLTHGRIAKLSCWYDLTWLRKQL